ncbi:PEP-CTERM sorting domain-containing protein [Limnofasciculus baicalensis]|uniref:PEP-CTERM sorting domain-containing protein n=1 Tax=Limnofasciculus baicalensis BBK-W-15 TaxID=2699891 RepID=A0AAE3GQD0_9CYAN|nr:PEP-CTERM sorting domain-containing protein [Limnofasciculus baicalensis]MCP2728127.1 PEP-CTERM sorting domain-containing protein [Limnofasciculus baicalensis BBK-W-15]
MNLTSIAKVSLAAAALSVASIAANLAPAQAALLNLCFAGVDLGTGATGCAKFTIDTSVQDENPAIGEGFFLDAVTNLSVNGVTIPFDLSIIQTEYNPGTNSTSWFLGGEQNTDSFISFLNFLDTNGNLANALSPNLSDYNFGGSVLGAPFAGILATNPDLNGGNATSMALTGLNDPTCVPEPGTVVSLLGLGMLGATSVMKRKMKG